jgi:hypothetical protein
MRKVTFLFLTVLLLFGVFPGGMNVLCALETASEPLIIIQAEDYDECGKGLLPEMYPVKLNVSLEDGFNAVTVRESNDIDGGYYVEKLGKEEWLAYTISVPQSGWYSIDTRVASINDGAFRMDIGGKNYVRTQAFPATGGSMVWQTVNIPAAYLPGGTDVLRFISEEDNLNVNWIRITRITGISTPSYYSIVPGNVQAEDYAAGGEGSAYHDTTPGNICYYAAYRFQDVDVENSPVSGPSLINVGWIDTGEWMEYIVYAQISAKYYPFFVVAAPWGGRATLEFPAVYWRGTFSFSTSGNNQQYEAFPTGLVDLYQGTYLVKVTANQPLWNFDRLIFYYYMPLKTHDPRQSLVDDTYRLDKQYSPPVEEPGK